MLSLFTALALSHKKNLHQNKISIIPKPKVYFEEAPVRIDQFVSSTSDSEYVVENISDIIPLLAEENMVPEKTLIEMSYELEGKETTGRSFNTLTMTPKEEDNCTRTATLDVTEVKFVRGDGEVTITTKYTHISCRVIAETVKTTKHQFGKTKVQYIPRLLKDNEIHDVLSSLKEQLTSSK